MVLPCFAQTVHSYADSVELTPEAQYLTGNVQVFQAELQWFADRVVWGAQDIRLQALGTRPVRVRTPRWLLLAQQVRILLSMSGQEQIQAEDLDFTFDALGFGLQAKTLAANRERWDFQQVRFSIPGIPGQWQAEVVYYLPASQSLWLQSLTYYPLFSTENKGIALSWPDVQWSFADQSERLRLRPDFLAVQPRLQLGSLEDPWQGLDVGALAELWRTPTERVFAGAYYGQATGWRSTGLFEWQPSPGSRWLAQGSWQERSPLTASSATDFATTSAALDYFHAFAWEGSQPVWAQWGAYWQQPDTFLQSLGLPLRLTPELYSGAQFLLSTPPQIALEGRLEHVAMFGGQWGSKSRVSALWQGEMALGTWGVHRLLGSIQANLLYEPFLELAPTVGLRLSDLMAWSPQWTTGVYVEAYGSALPVSWFSAGRLSPWLGGLVQWQGEQVAVSIDIAFDPAAGMLRQWNTLTSWRYGQGLLHVGLFLMSEPQAQSGFIGGPRVSFQWLL